GEKRPSWFHYKMLGDYFKGTYYRDEQFANYTATGSGTSIAYFDVTPNSNSSESRGPEWLHYKSSSTYTTNFEGNLEGLCETKAFAARGASIAVMVLNHSGSAQSVSIRFGSGSVTGSAAKKFRFAMPVTA